MICGLCIFGLLCQRKHSYSHSILLKGTKRLRNKTRCVSIHFTPTYIKKRKLLSAIQHGRKFRVPHDPLDKLVHGQIAIVILIHKHKHVRHTGTTDLPAPTLGLFQRVRVLVFLDAVVNASYDVSEFLE